MIKITIVVFNITKDDWYLTDKMWPVVGQSLLNLLRSYDVDILSPISHKNYLTGYVADVKPEDLQHIQEGLDGIANAFELTNAYIMTEKQR